MSFFRARSPTTIRRTQNAVIDLDGLLLRSGYCTCHVPLSQDGDKEVMHNRTVLEGHQLWLDLICVAEVGKSPCFSYQEAPIYRHKVIIWY